MTVPPLNVGLELQQRQNVAEPQNPDWPLSPTSRRTSSTSDAVPSSSVDPSQTQPSKEQVTSADSTNMENSHSSPYSQSPQWSAEDTFETPGPENAQNSRQDPFRLSRPTMAPKASHTQHVLRYWTLEILTVIVAILLLGSIIALLSYYDGRYMPEWPFEINLNSAISFLSTFLKAAIVAAVAEIIGQIKWTWFTERTRPLHHLQDFDAASRSTIGSIRLCMVVLWNWGFTSAGLLGMSAALVTIASLAVGPVTQQAIKTSSCPLLLPEAQAAMPGANYVPGSSAYYRIGAGQFEIEVDMKSTMIKGLTDRVGSDTNGMVDVSCKTGNCTWPDYGTGVTHATIGLCSKCLDITEFVSEPNEGGNLTLPDYEAYINYQSGDYMWIGYSNLSAYTSLFDGDFANAAAVSLSNFSILATSTSPCTTNAETNKLDCPHAITQATDDYYSGLGDYVAASCVLYPCMKEYWADYESNKLTETLVRETVAVPNTQESTEIYSAFANYTAVRSPCVMDNGTWYDRSNQSAANHIDGRTWANITLSNELGVAENVSVPNACLYKMDGTFYSAVGTFISELFDADCTYDNLQSGHINCGDSWWLIPLWGEMNSTFTSLDEAISDFTNAITNKFRMTGRGPDQKRGGPTDPAETYGSVFETSTCTYFDRQWIALPTILVLICIILLTWICVKNYNDPEQPVWKGSVLPLMFFGLDGTGSRMSRSGMAQDMPAQGRSDRNATFFRQDGRAAPELDRIQGEAGKMWVRFHGGTDRGFVDLGGMGSKNNRQMDAEASVTELVPKPKA